MRKPSLPFSDSTRVGLTLTFFPLLKSGNIAVMGSLWKCDGWTWWGQSVIQPRHSFNSFDPPKNDATHGLTQQKLMKLSPPLIRKTFHSKPDAQLFLLKQLFFLNRSDFNASKKIQFRISSFFIDPRQQPENFPIFFGKFAANWWII